MIYLRRKKNPNKHLQASKLIVETILSFKYINYKYAWIFFLWVTSHNIIESAEATEKQLG